LKLVMLSLHFIVILSLFNKKDADAFFEAAACAIFNMKIYGGAYPTNPLDVGFRFFQYIHITNSNLAHAPRAQTQRNSLVNLAARGESTVFGSYGRKSL
jgi:hypothetical protein